MGGGARLQIQAVGCGAGRSEVRPAAGGEGDKSVEGMKLRMVLALFETAAVLLGCPLGVWRRMCRATASDRKKLEVRHLSHLTEWTRRGIGELARFARGLGSP